MRPIIVGISAIACAAPLAQADNRFQVRQEFGPVQATRHVNGQQEEQETEFLFFMPARGVTLQTDPDTGATNPLYDDDNASGVNPFYKEDEGVAPFHLDLESLTISFGGLTSQQIGPDLFQRTLTLTGLVLESDYGQYSTLAGETILMESEGPAKYDAAPIEWLATSSIELHLNGDAGANDSFVFGPGSFLLDTLTPIPSPGAAVILPAAAGVIAARRRRR